MDKIKPSKVIKKISKNLFLAACEGLVSKALFEEGLAAGLSQEGEGFWLRGFGPLHASTLGCQAEHTRRLIGAGADVNLRDEYAVTPLMQACITGEEEVVRLLLGAGAKTNCLNIKGESPLVLAAGGGSVGVVRQLLAAGAQIDDGITKGWTALTEACRLGQVEVVLELLAAGASVVGDLSPITKDLNKEQSTEDSTEYGQADELRIWEPLLSAAMGNKKSCILALLKAGAQVDSRDGQEQTGLMIALGTRDEASVQIFMAAGADLDAKRSNGENITEIAKKIGPDWTLMIQVERVRREALAIEEGLGSGVVKPRMLRL